MKLKKMKCMMVAGLMLFPCTIFAKTASVVGCNYGLGNINTTEIATYVAGRVSNMEYQIFNTNAPTRSILTGQPISGQYFLESDIVYLAGHADNGTMSFYNCGGEKVGINKINQDRDVGSEGYYVGIGRFNLSKVKFAMLEGCLTASGTHNVASQFVNFGAKSSIGWSTEINTFSAKSWLTRFWDKINSGGTIAEANDYANSSWYTFSAIKNTNIYGNSSVRLNPLTYSAISNGSASYYNEYKVDKYSNNVIDTITEAIKEKINKKFDINDFVVTKSISNEKEIYDIGLVVNNIKVNVGYTVFVQNNIVQKIYDNTYNQNINEIKENIKTMDKEKLEKAAMSNNTVIYDYKKNKLIEYTQQYNYDSAGNKIIDVEEKEL